MIRLTELPPPPLRPAEAHKGTFGRVLILAGSPGMSGAAVLAGRGALRGGAGLVYIASPASVVPIIAASEPGYLIVSLSESPASGIDRDGRSIALARSQEMSALAVGPGCGRSRGFVALCRRLYRDAPSPLVLDADGLNAFAAASDALVHHAGPRILTPHPGEFARLTGRPAPSTPDERITQAVELATRSRAVVALKGAGTVVTDGERVFVNSTGNCGMATGGSGDVLTGLLAALLAQGMSALDAARLGVWMHGRAGDIAAATGSQPGLIASDLPDALCDVWRELGC